MESRHHIQGICLGWRYSSHVYIGANTCAAEVLLYYLNNLTMLQTIFPIPSAKFLSFWLYVVHLCWEYITIITLPFLKHCWHYKGRLIPTFRPLCTSLWMSKKGSLISSRSWLSILTIPSLSRIKSRWDPSPQFVTATGCLSPLNTSWAQ